MKLLVARERRSATAALGLAMAAILFAQVIVPGALALLSNAMERILT